jgi:hypothetical protein
MVCKSSGRGRCVYETISKDNCLVSRRVGACPPPLKRQEQALPLRGVAVEVLMRAETQVQSRQTYETASGHLPPTNMVHECLRI